LRTCRIGQLAPDADGYPCYAGGQTPGPVRDQQVMDPVAVGVEESRGCRVGPVKEGSRGKPCRNIPPVACPDGTSRVVLS
jgi:hypothetical protein